MPAITVRPFAAVTWPRPLRHAPSVTLNVMIDPAKSSDGSVWGVLVTERIPLTPGSPPFSVPLSADGNGLWSAAGLRPDLYELVIKDSAGSIVERSDVDLSNGSPMTLALSIHPIAVTGVLKVGDEPLAAADVRFTDGLGKSLYVTSDEDGRFTAAFPSPGRWMPLVYPYGRLRRTQVLALPVDVPAQADVALEIVLPGGRIRGSVVTQDGTPVKAAVHVVKDGAPVAQQITADDGKFDFIGLTEATYAITAESDDGASPRPLETRVGEDETTDVKIAIEPYRAVRGTVHTPSGQPASGAIVRISTDGGLLWTDLVVGVQGSFDYVVPGGVNDVQLVVVTYSYPAAMLRFALGNVPHAPLIINLLPLGGTLRVDPDRAYILRQNVVVPRNTFYLPSSLGLMPRAHLELGSFSVCRQPQVDGDCRRVFIAPGTSTTVSLRPEKGKENAR